MCHPRTKNIRSHCCQTPSEKAEQAAADRWWAQRIADVNAEVAARLTALIMAEFALEDSGGDEQAHIMRIARIAVDNVESIRHACWLGET